MASRDSNKRNPYGDREVRAFVDRAPRALTYSELAEACLAEFGRARAWSRSKIVRYCHTVKAHRGYPFKLELDPEQWSFVEDRIGRWTLTEIADACRRRYGKPRAVSRSSIHRFHERLRDQSRTAK